jgi:hypothetical protein
MAMQGELDAAAATLATAQQSFADGKYLVAESSGQSVRDQANAITADIAQAKTKKRST